MRLSTSVGSDLNRQRYMRPECLAAARGPDGQRRAQGQTNASFAEALQVQCDLDTTRYGILLRARRMVDLRGVGQDYSGTFYVKKVVHSIQVGQYKQRFTLTREGTGSLTPLVMP